MAGAQLDPGKVRKPIQLLAVMVAGLVLLVGLFLTAAAKVEKPSWAAGLLLITAVTIVPIFVGIVMLMWTKFRVHLQDDHYYAEGPISAGRVRERDVLSRSSVLRREIGREEGRARELPSGDLCLWPGPVLGGDQDQGTKGVADP